MADTIFLADPNGLSFPTNPSTVLVDLNEMETSDEGFGIVEGTLDLGSVPTESDDLVDRSVAGFLQADRYHGKVETTMALYVKKSGSVDVVRQWVRRLDQALDLDEGVLVVQLEGDSEPVFFDYVASPLPGILHGQSRGLFHLVQQLMDPEGLPITIWRQPYGRKQPLIAAKNLLVNPGLIEDPTSDGRPENWTWVSTTGISAENIQPFYYALQIATTTTMKLQQVTPTGTAAPGDVATFAFDALAPTGADVKMRAVVEFLTSAGASLVTYQSALVTLTPDSQRIFITTDPAPATTARMRATFQFENAAATARQVQLAKAMLEVGLGGPSSFRTGVESLTNVVGTTGNKFQKHLWVYNPGTAPALTRIRTVPEAGATVVAQLLATRERGNLIELHKKRGVLVRLQTLYSDTTAQTDAEAAAGSSAAKTTFATLQSMGRRWRWEIIPTDQTAFIGTWIVYAAVRPEVNTDKSTVQNVFRVQLKTGLRNSASPGETLAGVSPSITLDTHQLDTSKYVPLKLGTLRIPAGASGIEIEGWAGLQLDDDTNTFGSGALWWDTVWLVPADEQQTPMSVLGFAAGLDSRLFPTAGVARESWLGRELTGIGSVAAPDGMLTPARNGDASILNTQYEGTGVPPLGGEALGAGVWQIVYDVDVRANDLAAYKPGYVRARRAGTGAVFQISHAYTLGDIVWPISKNGRTYQVTVAGTSAGSSPTWPTTPGGTVVSGGATFKETTLAELRLSKKSGTTTENNRLTLLITTVASPGYKYEFVVVFDATTTSGHQVAVNQIERFFVRTIGSPQAMWLDGLAQQHRLTGAASELLDQLVAAGPYIEIDPGWALLHVECWDAAPIGYDRMDPRAPLPWHKSSRVFTVGADVVPRELVQ